jgi:hypothetical protein
LLWSQLGAITEGEELWVTVMMLPLLLVDGPDVIGEEYEEGLEVEELVVEFVNFEVDILDGGLEVVEFVDFEVEELDGGRDVVEFVSLEVDEKLDVLVEEEPR